MSKGNRFKNLILQRGYVETSSFAMVLVNYFGPEDFKSIGDAIRSLRVPFKEAYEAYAEEFKKVDKKYYDGRNVPVDFYTYCYDLWGADMQSVQNDLWEVCQNHGWDLTFHEFDWDNKTLIESAAEWLAGEEGYENPDECQGS